MADRTSRAVASLLDVGRHDLADDLDEGPRPFPDFQAFDPEVEYV